MQNYPQHDGQLCTNLLHELCMKWGSEDYGTPTRGRNYLIRGDDDRGVRSALLHGQDMVTHGHHAPLGHHSDTTGDTGSGRSLSPVSCQSPLINKVSDRNHLYKNNTFNFVAKYVFSQFYQNIFSTFLLV